VKENSEQSSNTDLGQRLRELRKERHLSLKELCARAQLSVAMLSHIERNQTNPSLKMLEKICTGLGVEMANLFPTQATDATGEDAFVIRAGARPSLALPHGVTKQLLSPSHKKTLELFILKVAPNGSSGSEPLIRAGEKAGMLLQGQVRLTLGARSFDIEEGDSFLFDSGLPHRFFNPGSVEAHILWIIRPNPVANEL
jgi:transcriptional regulator with XRE-family HTH domain